MREHREPNAYIEIFYFDTTETCLSDPCQGRYFLAFTTADASGVWNKTIVLSPGEKVLATATKSGYCTSIFSTCYTVTGSTVYGCTDPTAHNYDPEATEDDGSCETCDDGVQNGDETGVDCGGVLCIPCGNVDQPYISLIESDILEITYPDAVDPNTVNNTNLVINGDEEGFREGTYSVTGSVVSFTPNIPFKSGELLYITSTNSIENTAGSSFTKFGWKRVCTSSYSNKCCFYGICYKYYFTIRCNGISPIVLPMLMLTRMDIQI
ncbi:MAG: hypothetical protein R2771_14315 [Saprospiraceae bacterium]